MQASDIYLEIMNEIKDLETLGKQKHNQDILNKIESLVDDIELKYNELLNSKKEVEQSLELTVHNLSQEKNDINDEKQSLKNRLDDLSKQYNEKQNELERLVKETKENAEKQKEDAQKALEDALRGADENKSVEIESKMKELTDSFNKEKEAIRKTHAAEKQSLKDKLMQDKEYLKQTHRERLQQIKGEINQLKSNKKKLENEKNQITKQLKRVEKKLLNLQNTTNPKQNIPVAEAVEIPNAEVVSEPASNKPLKAKLNHNCLETTDDNGNTYYYNKFTNKTTWGPDQPDFNDVCLASAPEQRIVEPKTIREIKPDNVKVKEEISRLNKKIAANARYMNALPSSRRDEKNKLSKENKKLQDQVEEQERKLLRSSSRGGYRYGSDLASIHPSNIRSISPFSKIKNKTKKFNKKKSNKRNTKKINKKRKRKTKSKKRNHKKQTRKR